MRFFSIQLRDAVTGKAIITAGGKVYVAVNGAPAKQAIVDKDGVAATNPLTPTRGKIEFYVASDDTDKVDLYGITPGGHAFQVLDVTASGPNEININTSARHQVLVIPFDQADFTANTETATGFKTGTDKMWLPNPMVKVVDVDDGETIDVGTDGSGGDDADGFIDGVLLTTAGVIKATLLASADTFGALLSVLDSANAGDDAPEGYINSADEDITITTSAGADTGSGFIHLPYLLAA